MGGLFGGSSHTDASRHEAKQKSLETMSQGQLDKGRIDAARHKQNLAAIENMEMGKGSWLKSDSSDGDFYLGDTSDFG